MFKPSRHEHSGSSKLAHRSLAGDQSRTNACTSLHFAHTRHHIPALASSSPSTHTRHILFSYPILPPLKPLTPSTPLNPFPFPPLSLLPNFPNPDSPNPNSPNPNTPNPNTPNPNAPNTNLGPAVGRIGEEGVEGPPPRARAHVSEDHRARTWATRETDMGQTWSRGRHGHVGSREVEYCMGSLERMDRTAES